MSEVVFIGTSDAFGAGGRRQSAVLVRGHRGSALLDCGPTTNTGLADLGIARDEIEAIVISHFHGDHFGGIPLLLTAARYEDQRRHPLHIAGPPEVEQRVRALAHASGHDLEPAALGFPLHFSELSDGHRSEVGPLEVEAFATRHQLESHPHGHRVDAGGAIVVYSGDTGWFDGLPRAAAGADLFICECTYKSRQFDFHLNLDQLLEKRGQFDSERMILTHLGSEMANRRGEGPIDTADDGLVVRL